MAKEYIRDGTYYSWREIDGYNKAFNFAFSARGTAKTTAAWYEKIWSGFKKDHKPWIYMVRQTVEISEALINSIFDVNIRKFDDTLFEARYKMGSFKDGIVDVFVDFYHIEHNDESGEDEKKIDESYLFFRVVSLSIQMRRIKLAVLKNIKGVFMDEYIIDPKTQEHYQPREAFKIKEAYTTWKREVDGVLKFYFAANAYSLFNPLFVDWGVDTKKLKKGEFYVGDIFVIQWATLSNKLREKLIKENPLYQFDEEYSDYALEGSAINDQNIRLGKLPQNYHLQHIFRMAGKYIGIYANNYYEDLEDRFFVKFLDGIGAKRFAYCIDFEDMLERSVILSIDERSRLRRFKESMRRNLVSYEDINVYYYMIEIFKNL